MQHLMSASAFQKHLEILAAKIQRAQPALNMSAFVGIHTRGVPLAKRLAEYFQQQGHGVAQGMVDINLYRDDLSKAAENPIVKETRVDFGVDGKIIFLCDDVLYTGRTVRAAMDAIFTLGRPQAVHLVVWVKRNGRELPIDTHFYALDVNTKPTDNIKVKFLETDGLDDVTLLEKGEY